MSLLQKLPEQLFAVLVLFFYTGSIKPFIGAGHPAEPLTLLLPHLVAVITVVLLSLRWQKTLITLASAPLLWMLIGMVALSPFWSAAPHETWTEIAPLLRVTLFGLYLASRYSFKEILQIMAWALGLAAGLSLVFGALLPSYGVMGRGYIGQSQDWTHEGSWRGIYIHKVVLGSMMSLSILASLYLTSWRNPLRPLAYLALPIATLCLLLSTTKAALAALIIVLCCIPLYRTLRWEPKRILLSWGVGVPVFVGAVALVLGNAATILQAMGKNATLSGRTEIWPLVLQNIGEQPWFGYGYESFWIGGWEGPAANVWVYLPFGFEPPHAHNGFLDILLSVGVVGFSIFLLNIVAYVWRSVIWVRAHSTAEGLAPLLLLTFMVLVNITETVWMTPDIFWLGFTAFAWAIAKPIRSARSAPVYELWPAEIEALTQEQMKGQLIPDGLILEAVATGDRFKNQLVENQLENQSISRASSRSG